MCNQGSRSSDQVLQDPEGFGREADPGVMPPEALVIGVKTEWRKLGHKSVAGVRNPNRSHNRSNGKPRGNRHFTPEQATGPHFVERAIPIRLTSKISTGPLVRESGGQRRQTRRLIPEVEFLMRSPIGTDGTV